MRWLLLLFVVFATWAGACSGDDSDAGDQESLFPSPAIHTPQASEQAIATASPEVDTGTATADPTASPRRPVASPGARGPYEVGGLILPFEGEGEGGQARRVDTVLWYPAAEAGEVDPLIEAGRDVEVADGGPFPLVIFSHGDGGNPIQSKFLTTHLASHGFVVAGVSHSGEGLRDCFPCIDLEGDDSTFEGRLDDISTALAGLVDANVRRGTLRGAIDSGRAAIVGHSFGGHTTLVSLARDFFQAGVALAPVELNLEESELEDIEVPVLIVGGGLDDTASFRSQEQLYADLDNTESSLLVELPKGGHLSFTDYCFDGVRGCRPGDIDPLVARDAVTFYVTAFLRLYLAGEEEYRRLLGEHVGGARIVESDGIE